MQNDSEIKKSEKDVIEVESVEIQTPEPEPYDILEDGSSDYTQARYQNRTESKTSSPFGDFENAQTPFGRSTVFRANQMACSNCCLLVVMIIFFLLFVIF